MPERRGLVPACAAALFFFLCRRRAFNVFAHQLLVLQRRAAAVGFLQIAELVFGRARTEAGPTSTVQSQAAQRVVQFLLSICSPWINPALPAAQAAPSV